MTTRLDRTVEHLLHEADGEELCDCCLAFAAAASLSDVAAVVQRLSITRGVYRRTGRCATCCRPVLVSVLPPLGEQQGLEAAHRAPDVSSGSSR
jgi:hypothetical protein